MEWRREKRDRSTRGRMGKGKGREREREGRVSEGKRREAEGSEGRVEGGGKSKQERSIADEINVEKNSQRP